MKQFRIDRPVKLTRVRACLTCGVVILLATVAWAGGVPCWVLCHHPPKTVTAASIASVLRAESNPPLNILARSTGIVTTYLGKMLGVQGWRNYHVLAQVDGTVVHAASSSDGFYTIDIGVRYLVVGGDSVKLMHDSFIRVEVKPWVRKGAPLPVSENSNVCIVGSLMWDGDGFLEIHPQKAADIVPRSCSAATHKS